MLITKIPNHSTTKTCPFTAQNGVLEMSRKKLDKLGRLNPLDPYYEEKLPVNEYANPDRSLSRIYVWGSAVHGALGNPNFVFGQHIGKKGQKFVEPKDELNNPVRCNSAEQYRVRDVAAGYGFTVFASGPESPYLLGTGINNDGQIGYHELKPGRPLDVIVQPIKIPLPSGCGGAIRVEAGRSHTIALTKNNQVITMGNNAFGQCGRSIVPDEDYHRSNVVHRVSIPELEVGDKITDICSGADHSMFLSGKGQVFSCGWSADGQTGLGHYDNQDKPARVKGDIEGQHITKLACSGDCVLALNDQGEVFGWGNSEYGQFSSVTGEQQLSRPTKLDVDKVVGGKVIDIASGASICMVLNENRDLFVWGFGILGKGPKLEHSSKPTQIPTILFGKNEFSPNVYIDKIYCGLSINGALNSNGELFTWGKNRNSSLGLGNSDDQFFPLRVSCISRMTKVSFGVDHAVAMSDDVI